MKLASRHILAFTSPLKPRPEAHLLEDLDANEGIEGVLVVDHPAFASPSIGLLCLLLR